MFNDPQAASNAFTSRDSRRVVAEALRSVNDCLDFYESYFGIASQAYQDILTVVEILQCTRDAQSHFFVEPSDVERVSLWLKSARSTLSAKKESRAQEVRHHTAARL